MVRRLIQLACLLGPALALPCDVRADRPTTVLPDHCAWRVGKGVNFQHEKRVIAVAVSPKGGLVASSSSDDTVRVWDARTGRQVRAFQCREALAVCFSSKGDKLYCAEGGKILTFDLSTGKPLEVLDSGTTVQVMALSPDEKRVFIGGRDGSLRQVDVRSGKTRLLASKGRPATGTPPRRNRSTPSPCTRAGPSPRRSATTTSSASSTPRAAPRWRRWSRRTAASRSSPSAPTAT
jgi:WD40 repeat protein